MATGEVSRAAVPPRLASAAGEGEHGHRVGTGAAVPSFASGAAGNGCSPPGPRSWRSTATSVTGWPASVPAVFHVAVIAAPRDRRDRLLRRGRDRAGRRGDRHVRPGALPGGGDLAPGDGLADHAGENGQAQGQHQRECGQHPGHRGPDAPASATNPVAPAAATSRGAGRLRPAGTAEHDEHHRDGHQDRVAARYRLIPAPARRPIVQDGQACPPGRDRRDLGEAPPCGGKEAGPPSAPDRHETIPRAWISAGDAARPRQWRAGHRSRL